MRIRSYAKINLALEMGGKRKDNYHEITTLFQTIDFYDVLEFRPIPQDKIFLKGNDESISWGEENLIHQAAVLLKKLFRLSQGIEILVRKDIPAGRGLGGGSSNAAMALYALNKVWALGLGKNDLMDLGKELGADVPFFLEGGFCLGSGRGDEITPLADLPPLFCVLVLPNYTIPTGSVYEQHRLSLTSNDKDSKIIRFLESRDFGLLENDLEETVFYIYPQIKTIKSLFQSLESDLSLVTGTGSAVFGLFLEREKAEKGFEEIEKRETSLLIETLSRERYWKNVEAGV